MSHGESLTPRPLTDHPGTTEEIGLEDVEVVESLSNEESIGNFFKTPKAAKPTSNSPKKRPSPKAEPSHLTIKKIKDEEMESFANLLDNAMNSEKATPRPASLGARPQVKRSLAKRPRRRKPRKKDKPNAAAMKNRPIAAVGELNAQSSVANDAIPEDSLGGVQPPAPPPPKRKPVLDRTTRIQVPQNVESPTESSRNLLIWVLCVGGFLLLTVLVVGGLIWKNQEKKRREKELKQKLKSLKIQRIFDKKKYVQLPAGQCVKNMVWVPTGGPQKGFCIDVFEFPNAKGALPANATDSTQAQKLCASVGKRLCTKTEWQHACRGKLKTAYPYGNTYIPHKCPTKLSTGEATPVQKSGSWSKCHTPKGIFDMSGNMAEWVSGGALMGGSGNLHGKDTTCGSEGGGGGLSYYGTRCCTSPLLTK